VFADTFVAETSTGDVIYDDEDARRVDEYDFPRRLAETIPIHKRLEEGGERCKRVMRCLGSTPSCYRIENPHPTNSECMTPRDILARQDYYCRHDALLALHQRWALQYLSACRHAHAKGIVIASAPAECTWLRPDFSLVVVSLVAASCREIGVSAGDWNRYHSYPDSPFGPGCSRSIGPPYGVDECGAPRTDLFYWVCWVYELVTKRKSPVLLPEKEELGIEERRKRERAAEETVERGMFDDWPVLPEEQLGPCLIKVWKGEYETADEAFQDVRAMLERQGRVFATEEEDEFEGCDWKAEFGSGKR
jgi:hypothetical protein